MSEKQFSKEDLTAFATTFAASIINEMRKPAPPNEQELAELKQKQEERLATAQSVKEKNANKRFIQEKVCTHAHALREGGGTHVTYVHDNGAAGSPGYIYCQKCEGRIRPDEPIMRKLDPEAIFDSYLYNRLMQDCIPAAAEILSQ